MEDDFFQGDLQEYFESGDLYSRCFFQWSIVQAMMMESHILLEMQFPCLLYTSDAADEL